MPRANAILSRPTALGRLEEQTWLAADGKPGHKLVLTAAAIENLAPRGPRDSPAKSEPAPMDDEDTPF